MGGNHHGDDFFHDFGEFFSWCPFFITCFNHISTDVSFFIDIGVIEFGLEGDDRGLEGEVVELELDFELSSFKRCLLWAGDVDFPQAVAFSKNLETFLFEFTFFFIEPRE